MEIDKIIEKVRKKGKWEIADPYNSFSVTHRYRGVIIGIREWAEDLEESDEFFIHIIDCHGGQLHWGASEVELKEYLERKRRWIEGMSGLDNFM